MKYIYDLFNSFYCIEVNLMNIHLISDYSLVLLYSQINNFFPEKLSFYKTKCRVKDQDHLQHGIISMKLIKVQWFVVCAMIILELEMEVHQIY